MKINNNPKVMDDTNKFIIKQPLIYNKILPIVLVGLLFVALYLIVFEKEALSSDIEGAIAALAFLGIIFLGSLFLLINNINWKIEVFDTYCIHTNLFGRKKKYLYQDLRVIDYKTAYRVYLGKKRI
ncbi:DUF6560 family protein, partial [Acholeplasma laidlawii]